MSLVQLNIMYGHLEGTEGKFARDPSGYLSIEAGIYQKHGLEVSWNHVQGTEERYRRLEDGTAQISLVVGRASLQHFLDSKTTRILGCVMNSCPYYLVASPAIRQIRDLKGKKIAISRFGSNADFAAQVAFDLHVVGDDLADPHDLFLRQVLDPRVGPHVRLLEDEVRLGPTDPVDVREPDLDAFVEGKVYACNSCHVSFLLSLASVCAWGSGRSRGRPPCGARSCT